ncbi:hypothetical protein JCM10296v2_004016 [Rhodotorula toruloides]
MLDHRASADVQDRQDEEGDLQAGDYSGMDPQDHDPAGNAFDAALATDAGGQNGGAVDEDNLVEGYMELLRNGVACVAPDRKRWVLQDSDADYALPQRYVHLEGSRLETGFETTCSCSRGDSMRLCLRQQVLQRYWAFFGEEVRLGGGQDNPEAVFWKGDDLSLNTGSTTTRLRGPERVATGLSRQREHREQTRKRPSALAIIQPPRILR